MFDRNQCLILSALLVSIHRCLSSCTPSSEQCGCPYIKPISVLKIVGGIAARNHSWPWIAGLRRLSSINSSISPGFNFCGGRLIDSKHVLTAAHCFSSVTSSQIQNYFVVVGAEHKNDTNSVRLRIKSVTIHEHYKKGSYRNDIALLELIQAVNFNDSTVGFICLPPSNQSNYPNEMMNGTAIGWGLLTESGAASYTLQQVNLPIISNSDQHCQDVLQNNTIQFCAGYIQGGKDTCQGDSGGPLMIHDLTTDTWNIAGITSYGYGCAEKNKPGAYTRVSMYVDWINAHLNGKQFESRASIRFTSHLELCLFLLYFLFEN